MSPVLDTTFLIDYQKDPAAIDPFVHRLTALGEAILVPVQAAIEFASGLRDPASGIRRVQDAFVLVPCGPAIALEAARMGAEAFGKGLFPGWPDIQIAATARHEGMAIVSKNKKHFEALGIDVIEYP